MSFNADSLEPQALWNYFGKICAIPHGSGNEKALGEAVMAWGKDKGCDVEMDAKGNVIVRVPATPGQEKSPTIVIQGHMDMVCEKNSDTDFDFEKDPITLKRDGDWIMANGTTLGADNGMGLAAGLAFLDMPDAVHGPLEILCTVEEEIGLFGAVALEPDFVKGRMLLNLDSEEDGVFYVGCAGGRDSNLSLPITKETAPRDKETFALSIKGLRGGHSGLDIIQNRGNATRLLARAIFTVCKDVDLSLVEINGGDKHNAIPREAAGTVMVKPGEVTKMKAILEAQLKGFMDEFSTAEPDLTMTVTSADSPKEALANDSRDKVLRLILGLPHGVAAMVRGMDGMVETSTNVARVRTEYNSLTILNATRSAVPSSLEGVLNQIEAVSLAVGAKVKINKGYPGWMPNMDSEMLAKAKHVWREVHSTDAEFQVIHAGLECGIIGENYPGMDMISIGPTIQNPHSPEERVSIPTVVRFFDFVKAFVASFTNV
jgi:dipeptidase D